MRSDGVGGPVLVLTVVERLQRAVPSSSHTAYFKHFLIPFEHLLVLGNIDPSTVLHTYALRTYELLSKMCSFALMLKLCAGELSVLRLSRSVLLLLTVTT